MKRVRDIARQLACSSETVRRMLRAGKVPGCKVGRDWRADPDKVILALSNINTTPPIAVNTAR